MREGFLVFEAKQLEIQKSATNSRLPYSKRNYEDPFRPFPLAKPYSPARLSPLFPRAPEQQGSVGRSAGITAESYALSPLAFGEGRELFVRLL